MNTHIYILIIFCVENFRTCVATGRQYTRKSLYYPYKKPHKSFYLKHRRQYDYDNDEPTNSLYLPNFTKNITTDQSPTASGDTASSSSSYSSSNSSSSSLLEPSTLNTTSGNSSASVNDTIVNIETTTIYTIPENSSSSTSSTTTTASYNTTTEEFYGTERLAEDTSALNSVTSSLVSPPTFEWYSPGTIQERNVSNVIQIEAVALNSIAMQIKELSVKDGYFTACSIVLLRTLAAKNRNYVRCLSASLNYQIQRFENKEQLFVFGGSPEEIATSALQALASEPDDVMKNHLKYAIYSLENRQSFLKDDMNTLLDIVNTVYLERDGEDIAGVIEELKTSSCSTKKVMAEKLLRAFISVPFERVKNTAREHVVSAGIKHIIEMRFRNSTLH